MGHGKCSDINEMSNGVHRDVRAILVLRSPYEVQSGQLLQYCTASQLNSRFWSEQPVTNGTTIIFMALVVRLHVL